jgi:OmpA-OmpF porin, OOP family
MAICRAERRKYLLPNSCFKIFNFIHCATIQFKLTSKFRTKQPFLLSKTKIIMSFNLFDAAKGLFTNELVSKASSYLGESESGVSKAIGGILPSILSGIASKTSSASGATEIMNAAQEQHSSGLLGNLGSFFGNDGGGLLGTGAKLLSGLFGNKTDGLSGLISNFAGVKSSTATSLLSMAAPAILGFLGKHAADNKLNAGGLADMLSSQKNNIAAAMPAGLNLSSVVGDWGHKATNMVSDVKHTAANYADTVEEKSGGAMRLLLPVLLLALAAAAVLYFWKGCNKKTDTPDVPAVSVNPVTPAPATESKGTVDTDGNFVYNTGDTITITLPNGAGDLKVGKYSTEAKLVTFLQDGNQAIDTVKGNWFEFTNVHFKTGGSIIDDASMTQLKNMVAITKGFPTAQFKIGGYTDSTGSAAGNIALSQKRAEAVSAMIVKLGSAAKSITGAKGYGPAYPLATNTTPEGRAQNRRVAVNVKAK